MRVFRYKRPNESQTSQARTSLSRCYKVGISISVQSEHSIHVNMCQLSNREHSVPILESKGMHAIFQKKGKKMLKKGKNEQNI